MSNIGKTSPLNQYLRDLSEEFGYFTSVDVNGSIMNVRIKDGQRVIFNTKYRFDYPEETIIDDITKQIWIK